MTTRIDLGLDPQNPIVEGDDLEINTTVALDIGGTPQPLPPDCVLTYAVFDADPEVNSAATEHFRLTLADGIVITEQNRGKVTITASALRTSGLAGDRFHRFRVERNAVTRTGFVGTIRFRERAPF